MAGLGNKSHWQSAGDLSTTQEMVVVIAIGDNERIERALEDLSRLLSRHVGVLSVGDVQVMRPGRFGTKRAPVTPQAFGHSRFNQAKISIGASRSLRSRLRNTRVITPFTR